MIGWNTLGWGAACAGGALVFLRAVARDIDRIEQELRRLEQAEQKAWERRRNLGLLDAETVGLAA